MSSDTVHTIQTPFWAVNPNDTDWLAWTAIITIGIAIYCIMHLYATFDHWAESRAEGTILAKTVPTLLGIALLYEIFPLDHFSILLPLSAILIAVMADWMAIQAKHEPAAVDPVSVDPVSAESVEPELVPATKITSKTKRKPVTTDKTSAASIKPKSEKITNV